MVKQRLILVLLASLFSLVAKAQFENKLTLNAYFGLPFFPEEESYGHESVLQGFGSSFPVVGGTVYYAFNTKLSIGANLMQVTGLKENYSLSNTSLGAKLKYNFIHSDKPFSPYVALEPNIALQILTQQGDEYNETFDNSSDEGVTITDKTVTLPQATNSEFPTGIVLVAGFDFTLKQKYGLFFEMDYYANNVATLPEFRAKFQENQSKFRVMIFKAGIKFSLLKSKELL